jgi:ATP-dependent Clp protease ATP-binding subunit ClpA
MFERFTARSRRAVVLAQQEARLLNHNYIGTEHLLLGLLADPEGSAARTLESLDITLDAAREQVSQIIGRGSHSQSGHIPFTPRAKKVLELSLREALSLRSQSIESEHLLLGLVAEGKGVGAQILERLGAPLSTVRERAIEDAGTETDSDVVTVEIPYVRRGTPVQFERLGAVEETLASLDRRLAEIERRLGIAAEPAETEAAPGEPADDAEDTGPGESSGAADEA